MMKDVDWLSRYIDLLIHRYLDQSYSMRAADTVQRYFAYCHDTFTSSSNPRRFVSSDTIVVTKSSSTLSPIPLVHHAPINLISTPILQSVPPLRHKPPIFITVSQLKIFCGYLLTLSLNFSAPCFLISQAVLFAIIFLKLIVDATTFLLSFYHYFNNLSIQHFHICFITYSC